MLRRAGIIDSLEGIRTKLKDLELEGTGGEVRKIERARYRMLQPEGGRVNLDVLVKHATRNPDIFDFELRNEAGEVEIFDSRKIKAMGGKKGVKEWLNSK